MNLNLLKFFKSNSSKLNDRPLSNGRIDYLCKKYGYNLNHSINILTQTLQKLIIREILNEAGEAVNRAVENGITSCSFTLPDSYYFTSHDLIELCIESNLSESNSNKVALTLNTKGKDIKDYFEVSYTNSSVYVRHIFNINYDLNTLDFIGINEYFKIAEYVIQ